MHDYAANLLQAVKLSRELIDRETRKEIQHVKIMDDRIEIYGQFKNKVYIPSETALKFHDDDSFVRLVVGPYGSGKSTMCCFDILRRTCEMPAWHNGRRKAKWAIVRNTSGELVSTTLQTWLQWFGELGYVKKRQKPLMTYEHIFNDGNGAIELELIFIALDREDDIRKIKSLEVTGAYINELSEVPQGALSHFKGRVNKRYPSAQFCSENYWSGIICDTNPPDIDHWIYRDFEIKALESYAIHHQPHGLLKDEEGKWLANPNCDNANNLASDYYLKLAEGQTEDFVKVYCLGEYGSVGFGKKVYPEYQDDLHCTDEIPAIQGEQIHLGWDFGLTPACVVVQLTSRGQLCVLKEYTSDDMGIRTFAESVVLPSLRIDFPTNKIGFSRADPSGLNHDQVMELLSCIGELNSLGIATQGASSNLIPPRLAAVKFFLTRMVDGKPRFLMSKKGCPTLRRGFVKDYCYKRISISGEERYREVPHKSPSSHPHDALQYIAMEFASTTIIEEQQANKPVIDMYNPVFRWQG